MTGQRPETGRWDRTVCVAGTGLGFAATQVLILSRGFYGRTVADIFFSLLLAGSAFVFLRMPDRKLFWRLALTTCALIACQTLFLRVRVTFFSAAAVLGLSSILLLALRYIWSEDEQRKLHFQAFLAPMLLVLLAYVSPGPMDATNHQHPRTFDLPLLAFDAGLGVQLSYEVGQLVLRWHWLTRIAIFFYFVLPLALMFIYAQRLRAHGKAAVTVFLAIFIAGPLGIIFYNLLPACGPIYLAGAKFPFAPLSISQVRELLIQPVSVQGMRNAFPSLHMAWALLAWWCSEGLSWRIRSLMLLLVAGTVLATLGLGEHYFVDLVAAFPFALMIISGCALQVAWSDRRRSVTLFSGLLMMLGWVVLLRFWLRVIWLSILIPWAFVVATIVSCVLLEPCLRSATAQFEKRATPAA